MNIPESFIAILDKRLYHYQLGETKPVVRIKWRGKYIAVPGGKAVWPSVGAAKNAFRRFDNLGWMNKAFQAAFPDKVKVYSYIDIPSESWNEFTHELERLGLLEFEVTGGGK